MRIQILLLSFFLLGLPHLFAQEEATDFKKLTRVPKSIPEISGIYIQGDSIWSHNDSGGDPVLFAFDVEGNLLDSVYIEKTQNQDWEELTHDELGNVYICDFGNNNNQRENLRIFKYHPDQGWLGTIFFKFEDQKSFPPASDQRRFDAEGAFWYEDSIYIFSKNRSGFYTYMYVIPDIPGTYTAVLKDSIDLKDRIVTAASLSPDKSKMALLGYTLDRKHGFPKFLSSLFVFTAFTPGNFCDGEMLRIKLPHRQFEALDFRTNDLIYLGAEKTPIHKPILGEVDLTQLKYSPAKE
ncbi:MAG: hypothetical protein R8P61_28950 [Bacteroidia bacterium]|nr:hypothetical protein [Bacteroidia bacterium]